MSIIDILELLEKTHSTNEKIAIIRKYQDELKNVFKYTYDQDLSYHIKLKEEYDAVSTENDNEDFTNLYSILNKANEGKINRAGILEYVSTLHGGVRKWSIRIINRDLKIGIGKTIIYKIYPDMIRKIKVQLATPLSDIPNFSLEDKEWLIEPKYDGIRCIIVLNDTIEVYTRNGKTHPNVKSYLENNCNLKSKDIVLDCEAFDKDWNTTVTSLSKEGLNNLSIYAFDIYSIEEFNNGHSSTHLIERKKHLENFLNNNKCDIIKMAPFKIVKTLNDALLDYKILISKGYEGAMLKLASSAYEGKRTKTWIKIKEKDEFTVKVIGMLPGSGRFHDTLGSLQVKGKNKNGEEVEFKVGGGFSDEQRKYFWEHPYEIMDKCIDVSTFPSGSKTAKVSFPVFIRVRTDIDC